MDGNKIKLMITDFDGTLVDTFRANFLAYQKAFAEIGMQLSEDTYKVCFGYRFEEFMDIVNVKEKKQRDIIKGLKTQYYPLFFSELKINQPLLNILKAFRQSGGKTAIASTARRKNLENVLQYFQVMDVFDLIVSGEEVKVGKPSPEIYKTVISFFDVDPCEAIVFEDSEIGINSAKAAGINYIIINSKFYAN